MTVITVTGQVTLVTELVPVVACFFYERLDMSYADELDDFMDEQERLHCEAVVRDFTQLGNAGIDVPTELLDKGKTAEQVFDLIRSKQR